MMNNKKNEIYFKVADGKEKIDARRFVAKKYYEAGYLDKSDASKPFKDDYVDSSVYFIAKTENKIIGTLRIVSDPKIKLPVINEFDLYPEMKIFFDKTNKKKVVEIGNLAAISNTGIAKGLYGTALIYSRKKGYKFWIAGVDNNFLKGLKKKYKVINFFYKQIGEPKHYIGSLTVPIMIPIWPLVIYNSIMKYNFISRRGHGVE